MFSLYGDLPPASGDATSTSTSNNVPATTINNSTPSSSAPVAPIKLAMPAMPRALLPQMKKPSSTSTSTAPSSLAAAFQLPRQLQARKPTSPAIKPVTAPLTSTSFPSSSFSSTATEPVHIHATTTAATSASIPNPIPFFLSSSTTASPLDASKPIVTLDDLPPTLDEYDPSRPNDYEEYVFEREAIRQREREQESLRRAQEQADVLRRRLEERGTEDEYDRDVPMQPVDKAQFLKVSSGEEAFLRRQALSMPTPSGSSSASFSEPAAKRSKPSSPSAVILLTNMVGRDGVDDELSGEIEEECTKFGSVQSCVVHVMHKSVRDDEAVRIFVRFNSSTSAQKAITELNGRFFDGRVVKAAFYSEEAFERKQYEQ